MEVPNSAVHNRSSSRSDYEVEVNHRPVAIPRFLIWNWNKRVVEDVPEASFQLSTSNTDIHTRPPGTALNANRSMMVPQNPTQKVIQNRVLNVIR